MATILPPFDAGQSHLIAFLIGGFRFISGK